MKLCREREGGDQKFSRLKRKDKKIMSEKRPDNMERIVTKELADAFVAEQVKEIQAQ